MRYIFIILFGLIIYKAEAQSSALRVADSLAAVGNHSKAIATYSDIGIMNAPVALKIARSYKALGNDSKALQYYQSSLEQDKTQVIAATEYGRLLIATRKFKKGDSIFNSLSERYPGNPEFYYQRGRALKAMGPQIAVTNSDTIWNWSDDAFAKALKADSTHLKAMYEIGLGYVKNRTYDKLEKLAPKGLAIDPENIELLSLLAQSYSNKGWYSEAIDYFEKLIDLGQSTPFIHRKLGFAYAKDGFPQLAIEQYAILINEKGEDKNPEHHLALARLYQRTKDLDKGIRHAEIALFLMDQPLEDPYFTLATLHKLKEEYQLALENYQFAVRENPKNIAAHYGIAVAADNFYKDKKEVLRLYERFIELFKEDNRRQAKYYRDLAQYRVDILTQEVFMKADKGG
ncbi:hypothetical protein EAX61_08345 [Dokdonia sinensis]|uniref:Uncharacterized protein n=1 Tax=Dokdonia sinensis TaxID=2479847 RepID=A0A3M0G2A0_9FLAO|nr:tetratricopeptide repeat protein [Dokdonia sinensis]RMB59064.1 hypothetical protein EAX61_08345 [Dokdonia sinensis]